MPALLCLPHTPNLIPLFHGGICLCQWRFISIRNCYCSVINSSQLYIMFLYNRVLKCDVITLQMFLFEP